MKDTFSQWKNFDDIITKLNDMLADEDPELAKKMGVIKSDEPEESTAREKTGDEKDEENDLEG